MLKYVSTRIAQAVLIIVVATFAAGFLLRLVPGSIAHVILGENATPESVARLEQQLGLNQSVFEQYADWLRSALNGDLGTSPLTGIPVTESIAERLPVTLELASVALAMALLIGIPAAIGAASRPEGFLDRVTAFGASAGLSIPAFVAAPVMVYVFAVTLDLLPSGGWVSFSEDPLQNLQHVLLPAAAIALSEAAAFQRLLRADLRTTLREEYIEAARARGLGRPYIMWRHALRPSSFSTLTLAGVVLGRLLAGSIIVESLFSLPGLGSLIISSINNRDVVVVQGALCVIVVGYVATNTLIEIAYGTLDPRVRTQRTAR